MYKRDICQIDKTWLKGRLQEGVIDIDTGEVIAITSENGDMAERIAQLMNACDGLQQEALGGGWTARGLINYAKRLESALLLLRGRLLIENPNAKIDDIDAILLPPNVKLRGGPFTDGERSPKA